MCGCSSSSSTLDTTVLLSSPCDSPTKPGLERTRFYPRMLVGPADLTQDQIYFREKMRRHNRMLHGWGVVCGIGVVIGDDPCAVIVRPGYLLGPYGDEIVVSDDVTLDLCKMGAGERLGCCSADADPWCADTRVTCDPKQQKYLAIRYAECRSNPVRAAGNCGCGCSEGSCEYSRIRDSYAFKVLDALPAGYDVGTDHYVPTWTGCSPDGKSGRACPPCPADPWVIIATIEFDSSCNIVTIDCYQHRRYVVTFAGVALHCGSAKSHQPWKPTDWQKLHGLLGVSGEAALLEHGLGAHEALRLEAGVLVSGAKADLLRSRVAGMTLEQVATLDKDSFTTKVTTGVAAKSRAGVKSSAEALWKRASDIVGMMP